MIGIQYILTGARQKKDYMFGFNETKTVLIRAIVAPTGFLYSVYTRGDRSAQPVAPTAPRVYIM